MAKHRKPGLPSMRYTPKAPAAYITILRALASISRLPYRGRPGTAGAAK